MMDDLWVIIHPGWMIWEASWMMALDDEKKHVDFCPRGAFHFYHPSIIPVSNSVHWEKWSRRSPNWHPSIIPVLMG